MKNATTLAAAILAVASIPLLAQQADPANPQQTTPSAQAPAEQAQPPAQPQAQPAQPTAPTSAVASVQLSPVNGELVDKLDTRTAKTGDSVVIKTKSNVKTADGTDIPKGSKLIGRVVQVKPSGDAKDNSQVALQFDRAELKGGQSLPIHSEIQSISPSGSDVSSTPDAMAAMPSGPAPSGSGPAAASAPNGSMNSSSSAAANTAQTQPQMNGASPAGPAPGTPAPGTVVARTGNIAIRTTSIPGVLLASNEPGQQDPRMAQSSGIILGAKSDVHLDSGTKVVIGVAAATTTAAGGGN
jgi:hypothetical protein